MEIPKPCFGDFICWFWVRFTLYFGIAVFADFEHVFYLSKMVTKTSILLIFCLELILIRRVLCHVIYYSSFCQHEEKYSTLFHTARITFPSE